MKVSRHIIILAIVLITGCSSTLRMDQIMSAWTGTHINDLIAKWGNPNETGKDGKRNLYLWNNNKPIHIMEKPLDYHWTRTRLLHGTCQRIMETDQSGVILDWSWQGNLCQALHTDETTDWENQTANQNKAFIPFR